MNNIVIQEQVTKIDRSHSYNDGIESYLLDKDIVLGKNHKLGDKIYELNTFILNDVSYYSSYCIPMNNLL